MAKKTLEFIEPSIKMKNVSRVSQQLIKHGCLLLDSDKITCQQYGLPCPILKKEICLEFIRYSSSRIKPIDYQEGAKDVR